MNKSTILYIDGENFLFRVADVLKAENLIKHKSDIHNLSIVSLQASAMKEYSIDQTLFYACKINIPKEHPTIAKKSQVIAEAQRRLKRSLVNQKIDFVMSGNVRLQGVIKDKNGKVTRGIFKEKGTDVKLAVDALAKTCDGELETALILSSDSDMQPLVKELKKRGVKVVYIGFENAINVGLSLTCNSTILIRNTEVIEAWNEANPQKALIK